MGVLSNQLPSRCDSAGGGDALRHRGRVRGVSWHAGGSVHPLLSAVRPEETLASVYYPPNCNKDR